MVRWHERKYCWVELLVLNSTEMNATSNDIIFVGIARMRKRRITELSLLEASKEEYVTRHLVDGRIIFCDHRISVVAGYMTHEVSGMSAFKYMHAEDVLWTIVALRQSEYKLIRPIKCHDD